ncbi:bifunctional DNA primase/polymerase [Nocardia sp. CA-290969]|uniref:bifunctional DNA primase/polymerase n=1 Tax=Nocardia sp. CA-290969 TaxID=3239986 RepID=UPI003D8B4EC7
MSCGPDLESVQAAALAAAGRGWPVFPLRPGSKVPAIEGWQTRASTDDTLLRTWWRRVTYNIGIATEPAGLHVVDLDADHLQPPVTDLDAALDELATVLGEPVPDTFTVTTPGGGWHLYYRAPPSLRLPCTVARLGPGIDTRGHGGYIVAPGSVTACGHYRILRPHPLADLPATVIDRLTPSPPPLPAAPLYVAPRHSRGRLRALLEAIVARETDAVALAAPGTRNTRLFHAALTLGRLVAGGELDEHDARAVLSAAAAPHIGIDRFTTREVDRTITSGFRYGARRPRRL